VFDHQHERLRLRHASMMAQLGGLRGLVRGSRGGDDTAQASLERA
jgi:hypothetical protein